MTEAQSKITGGRVTFGLTVCAKQYESKRIDVEFAFSVKEDDSYERIFDKACVAAVNRCRELVGLPVLDAKAIIAEHVKPTPSGLFGE